MKKSTKKEYIQKFIEKHGNKYDYSLVEYINNCTKVKIICPIHGIFEQRPNDHAKGSGCPKCSSKKLTPNEYIERCNIIHNNYYDYSFTKYVNMSSKIKIICPIHGIFEQRADSHIKGHKCKKCTDDNLLKTTEYFIQKSNEIHNNMYDYSKSVYTKATNNIIITCKIHGDFVQKSYHHLGGSGCPKCSMSKGEKKIMIYLENSNIKYNYQKTFKNCKGKKNKLPFDFYLPNHNICIEFDGQQHYEPIEYFGGKNTFNNTLITDKIKTEYCKNNNIQLIRIRYDEDIYEKLNFLSVL